MRSKQRNLHFLTLVSFLLSSSSSVAGSQIRLAGSRSTLCSGRVEIYYSGAWGTVCDDSWDLNDATVVCRQLGCGTALNAMASAHFGQGTDQIWLDDVNCSGSERSLAECRHRGFGTHDCGHGEDAGVICSGVRLAGSTRCSGRVEILHSNTWGTVCDDNWDLNDAEVVCRELSCGTALSAPPKALFGQGTDPIWLDEVNCSGQEKILSECRHRGFGTHDCGHDEDAGVVCSVSLPKPSISMSPADEVTWGQDVSFTCSNSAELQSGTFSLKKTSGSFNKTQMSHSSSAAFSIPTVDFDKEGLYQCQYEKTISGQTFSSHLSDSVKLSVTVSFPEPSISMNPAGEVTWRQDVGITCLIQTQVLGGTFILQQTSGSFRKTQTSSTSSTTFNIPKVDFDNQGSYQCQYERSGPSRNFRSPLSNTLRLLISVKLPQPSISLTSPNEGLVLSPEGAEVTRGYSVVITCFINCSYPDGHFFLIFSGSNIISTKSAVNHSASFDFPVAEYEHQGNYSCVYEVTLSARRFNSTETTPIIVIVKVPLLPLVSSVASGILLLLLLILLVICLVHRRRRQAKQPVVLVLSQLTDRAGNDYEDEEDEDYVNVDLLDTKEKLKEEAGKVEEEYIDDYEEPESDEGHDYEEAGPTPSYIVAGEVLFTAEESREDEVEDDDEEDETSDDENDYENITESICEQTVEINGQNEDIYQNF